MLSTKQRFLKMKSSLKLNSFYKSPDQSDDETSPVFHDCNGSSEKISTDKINTMNRMNSPSSSSNDVPTWSSSGYNSGRTSECESENASTNGGTENEKSECSSNSSGSEKRIKIKRNVQFNHTVAVRSIPSRKELIPIFRDIWYTGPECEAFKRDAYIEMKNYIDKHKCSIKQAMLDLHQPEEEFVETEDETSLATLYSAFDKWATDHLNFTSPRIMSKENSFNSNDSSSCPEKNDQLLLQRRQEREERDAEQNKQDHNNNDCLNNFNHHHNNIISNKTGIKC